MKTLQVRRVCSAYNDRQVLEDISLEVRPGEVLALIGPNGVGKTTLLRTMARLFRPRAGVVFLGKRELYRMSPRETALDLALAPQSGVPTWPLTVEQVVTLGRAPHRGWLLPFAPRDREVVERVLRQMALVPLRGRPITALSGGEQRRVILARALAQEPRILLLDEPTASLDLKYQTEILELVHTLAHRDRLAVVVSLHDLNLAALYADQLALLQAGRLVALGPPVEVLVEELLTEVYGVAVHVTRHPLYGTPQIMPVLNRVDRATSPHGDE